MPQYAYECRNGACGKKEVEVVRVKDLSECDSPENCEECREPMKKLIGSMTFRYGCGGFHNTDYSTGRHG